MTSSERTLNLWIGVVALICVAALIGYVALKPILNQPSEPAQRFVAYFENAGGIEAGDIVRIKGRRAGKVVATDIVQRDGKVQVRIEFEIAPGSGSQWLKEGGIPADSVIRVRQASIVGRPTLNIVFGEKDELIHEGGEWKNAEGLSGQDQFETWLSALRKFDAAVDKYMGYVRPEMLADIKLRIAELRLNIDNVRSAVDRGVDAVPGIVKRIDDLSRTLAELNADMHKNLPQISKNLESLNTNLEKVPASTVDAEKSFAELRTQIARFDEAISANSERAENGDFGKSLREFRRWSTQLRAGAVRAETNPKQAGDLPPWRLSRRYFNGGESVLEPAETAEKGGASDYKELPPAPKPRPKPKTED